jgi:hypothetical protein
LCPPGFESAAGAFATAFRRISEKIKEMVCSSFLIDDFSPLAVRSSVHLEKRHLLFDSEPADKGNFPFVPKQGADRREMAQGSNIRGYAATRRSGAGMLFPEPLWYEFFSK